MLLKSSSHVKETKGSHLLQCKNKMSWVVLAPICQAKLVATSHARGCYQFSEVHTVFLPVTCIALSSKIWKSSLSSVQWSALPTEGWNNAFLSLITIRFLLQMLFHFSGVSASFSWGQWTRLYKPRATASFFWSTHMLSLCLPAPASPQMKQLDTVLAKHWCSFVAAGAKAAGLQASENCSMQVKSAENLFLLFISPPPFFSTSLLWAGQE